MNSQMASGLTGDEGTGASGKYSINDKNDADFAIFDQTGDTAPGIAVKNVKNRLLSCQPFDFRASNIALTSSSGTSSGSVLSLDDITE